MEEPAQVINSRLPEPNAQPIKINDNVTIFPRKPAPRRKRWFTTTKPATFADTSLVSAFLGAVIGIGLSLSWRQPSIGIYLMALGTFHLLEFVITAKYNARNLGMCSFLLTNGGEYIAAQLFAILEYLWRYRRADHDLSYFTIRLLVGLCAIVSGQSIRSLAMIQAAQSFNHYVQEEKNDDHVLVTRGLYAFVRHPSYFGYYIWVVGSQLVLGNYVSLVLFSVVVNVYFVQRLKGEEAALIRFFGNEYIKYKRKVWSGIPFSA